MKKILVGLTALALLAFAVPALALDGAVINVNKFTKVENSVMVVANTGGNITSGGDAGSGGTSKAIAIDSSNAYGGSANGGSGGSNSGDISTGNAYAKAKVVNIVNTSYTATDGGFVLNKNKFTKVDNEVGVAANSGENSTWGGFGGDGGYSKAIAFGGSNAYGGSANGGSGGSNSGDISTGNAHAKAKVFNLVNTSITRTCCSY
ncbi:MAG: hypothetical protein ACOZAL_03780 [Patescibacteria group bacterium]